MVSRSPSHLPLYTPTPPTTYTHPALLTHTHTHTHNPTHTHTHTTHPTHTYTPAPYSDTHRPTHHPYKHIYLHTHTYTYTRRQGLYKHGNTITHVYMYLHVCVWTYMWYMWIVDWRICGLLGAWIHSFLTDRSQIVATGGATSSPSAVLSGVPQGSVLGPLLFLIHIMGIDDHVTHSTIASFADDIRILMPLNTSVAAACCRMT